ncbi:hypothetical protein [Clostridium perfringens]|nr:hypothetical protein [Clostridium perfringens]
MRYIKCRDARFQDRIIDKDTPFFTAFKSEFMVKYLLRVKH